MHPFLQRSTVAPYPRHRFSILWLLLTCVAALAGDAGAVRTVPPPSLLASVHAHMEYLAGDHLHGRGSGTADEHAAAVYLAAQLKHYGVEPAGQNGRYIDQIEVDARRITAPPALSFRHGEQEVRWIHGKEFVAVRMADDMISGPLQKIAEDGSAPARPGAVIFLVPQPDHDSGWYWSKAYELMQKGAAAVLLPAAAQVNWETAAGSPPLIAKRIHGGEVGQLGGEVSEVVLNSASDEIIASLAEGAAITLQAPMESKKQLTWNVVGKLPGTDPALGQQAVVLSAHLDHLGIGPAFRGKTVYHGADDDASGVTAVLELARIMAVAPRPRRTVVFAFFGSEEVGGLGSTYFTEHPPVPLDHIVADLEFEMLGRPDKTIGRDALWLSGFKRTDLGPELDAHQAPLVPDPHPEQHFFSRSDNYVLAKKGVVAQTVSSYGLHRDYHRPTDDLAHIDFNHLTTAIQSMIAPVNWLANSDFWPRWNPGEKP